MPKPGGDGVPLFYTSILMLVLSWVTFTLRIAVRVWRKALGLDDLAMLIGILLFTVTACLCIVCSWYGSGQLAAVLTLSTIQKGTKLFFIAEFFYASSTVAIKCSIAITLLRIAGTRRGYVWAICSTIVASLISVIIFIIGVANICHPINTLWGESNGTCNLKLNSDVSFFFSAIEIATDWTLAILPAVLLRNIQMKSRVKISVAAILGLAAFASCATIVRLRYLSLYSDPAEFMFSTGKIGLWSVIEEGIGIFAGSLPALRPLLSLPIFGTSTGSNGNSASAGNKYNKPRTKRDRADSRGDVMLDTFKELPDKYGDEDSQKHILRETRVTMTSNKASSVQSAWDKTQALGWKKNQFEQV